MLNLHISAPTNPKRPPETTPTVTNRVWCVKSTHATGCAIQQVSCRSTTDRTRHTPFLPSHPTNPCPIPTSIAAAIPFHRCLGRSRLAASNAPPDANASPGHQENLTAVIPASGTALHASVRRCPTRTLLQTGFIRVWALDLLFVLRGGEGGRLTRVGNANAYARP